MVMRQHTYGISALCVCRIMFTKNLKYGNFDLFKITILQREDTYRELKKIQFPKEYYI